LVGRGGGDRTIRHGENVQVIHSMFGQKLQNCQKRRSEVHGGYTEPESDWCHNATATTAAITRGNVLHAGLPEIGMNARPYIFSVAVSGWLPSFGLFRSMIGVISFLLFSMATRD
jgi:hypothetical protein